MCVSSENFKKISNHFLKCRKLPTVTRHDCVDVNLADFHDSKLHINLNILNLDVALIRLLPKRSHFILQNHCDLKTYYQIRFNERFLVASRSILAAALSINNTRLLFFSARLLF